MSRTQQEIDELIATGEMERMVARAHARIASEDPGVLTIEGPALIALAHVARRPQSTDRQIDAAVATARRAGHTWAEIEPVLRLLASSVAVA